MTRRSLEVRLACTRRELDRLILARNAGRYGLVDMERYEELCRTELALMQALHTAR